jgi:serine/threonine protein kinase
MEFLPRLHASGALPGAAESGGSSVDEDTVKPTTPEQAIQRFVGDESARLRFLREARAAASVRHPNVASVFHLGRSGGDYFYAMESNLALAITCW